jgi:hypothetical protein
MPATDPHLSSRVAGKNESNPYQPFDAVFLRTPLFPLEFLPVVCGPEPWSSETARRVCEYPEIREAILLASPDLYQEMERWLAGNLTEERSLQRFFFSLQRYAVRLSMRCTPFGLFAGFSCGGWGENTAIELAERSSYQRHTRLDMHYLCALALDLAKKEEIASHLLYFPNSSLHRVGGQYRYVEYRYVKTSRTHHIVAVDHTAYLEKVLDRTRLGDSRAALAELLVDEEINIEEAREYIQELIDNQVLVHSLEPTLTGPEFIEQVMAVLRPLPAAASVHQVLELTRESLAAIDRAPLGETEGHYFPLAERLKPLGTAYELKFLFQTDMLKPIRSCTVERHLGADVLTGLTLLNRLTPPPRETNLSRFREAFLERYEQREVPLLEVLDTEMGIGYRQGGDGAGDVAPLVDDLALPDAPGSGGGQTIPWSGVNSFLFDKYRKALAEQTQEVIVTDEEVADFPLHWDDLPDTLAVMTHVLQPDAAGGAPTVIMPGVSGHAANLLGRFCHTDVAIHELVKRIMTREAELNPNVIYAEVVHLPDARLGNILLRPVLREYEIPYLARSAVATGQQIRLDDLVVAVRQNRVVLRSLRLAKEVRPRLTSAHNFSFNALPIYQFLCDLQSQNLRGGVYFSWGSLAQEMPFLPRVRYRNLILCPATWQIKAKEIQELVKNQGDDAALRQALDAWRLQACLPAVVCLADSDNELYIHFDNLLSVRSLLAQVKNRSGFKLVEFPFTPENTPVRSPDGSFANEVFFCFQRSTSPGEPRHD